MWRGTSDAFSDQIWWGFFGSFQQEYDLSDGLSLSSVSASSSARLILMGIAEDLDQMKHCFL